MSMTEECGICGRCVPLGSGCDSETSLSCLNNVGGHSQRPDDFVDTGLEDDRD
jgi:hypothetical protein